MKLIIPIEFYRKGGVERVIISLVSNLIESVDKIILVLPNKQIAYFQSLLPNSDVIIYESFSFPTSSLESKFLSALNKLLSVAKKLKLEGLQKSLAKRIQRFRIDARIDQLVRKHQATHCLYVLINRLKPPTVKIPLSGIAYDLFWRFAPLTYPDSYISLYDKYLLLWLEKADLILTISQKTRDDILTVFPNYQFASKLKAVPLAGFPSHATENFLQESETNIPTFYFPSSFGIYKDHLTLLKAGLKLAEKNINFKIVLVGRETDSLINGSLKLSQQSKTQEYQSYLEKCNRLCKDNKILFDKYFVGLGYCEYKEVESCYETCSCVVVPSQYEGFGLAVSEAIVRGLPVIASDLEVFQEQIDLYQCPDRIDLFSQGDVDALAKTMEQFIFNPKAKLSAEEIALRFSRWTWQDVAKEYVALLEQL